MIATIHCTKQSVCLNSLSHITIMHLIVVLKVAPV